MINIFNIYKAVFVLSIHKFPTLISPADRLSSFISPFVLLLWLAAGATWRFHDVTPKVWGYQVTLRKLRCGS